MGLGWNCPMIRSTKSCEGLGISQAAFWKVLGERRHSLVNKLMYNNIFAKDTFKQYTESRRDRLGYFGLSWSNLSVIVASSQSLCRAVINRVPEVDLFRCSEHFLFFHLLISVLLGWSLDWRMLNQDLGTLKQVVSEQKQVRFAYPEQVTGKPRQGLLGVSTRSQRERAARNRSAIQRGRFLTMLSTSDLA